MNSRSCSSTKDLSCPVTSKYFSKHTSMDDSLSDFQEPKKRCIGPKIDKTKPKAKVKKKVRKKLKGQKDIRTVLSKFNNLVSYSKNFTEICQQAGVDVDAEQLQVAIAMSNSLQVQETNKNGMATNPMTSQECRNKIKTTLLEYGFHIPDVIINNKKPTRTRNKKLLQNSKLMQISEEERQQIICDKYCQVLLNVLNSTPKKTDLNYNNTNLFNICTNLTYYELTIDKFYVKDLFEVCQNKLGNLLRDWSKIPGRPISPPCFETLDLSFTEVRYSQEELDVILSGRMAELKKIVKLKQNTQSDMKTKLEEVSSSLSKRLLDPDLVQNDTLNKYRETSQISNINTNIETDLHEIKDNHNIVSPTAKYAINLTKSNIRCISPDIFDDDFSITEMNVENQSMKIHKHAKTQESAKIDVKMPLSQPSLCCTKRNDNDFMDLTECFKKTENTKMNKTNELVADETRYDIIPSSQNSDRDNMTKRKSDDFMDLTECIKTASQKLAIIEEIDLTQTIEIVPKTLIVPGVYDHMDLTQSSDSNDSTLPYVFVGGNNKSMINKDDMQFDKEKFEVHSEINNETIFDDFVHHHSDHSSKVSEICKSTSSIDQNDDKIEIDLPQNINSEDFDHKPSATNTSALYLESNAVNIEGEKIIDLTQEVPSSEEVNKSENEIYNNYCISIDYGEVFDNINKKHTENSLGADNDDVNYLSQRSDVFEISDEEFDYSMHKSRFNNSFEQEKTNSYDYDLGTSNKSTRSCSNFTRSVSDGTLPATEIQERELTSPVSTPLRSIYDGRDLVKTPKSSEYIIKTNNVTPMVDYELMSSPERNKELDKYGLKPFKRKRAIQLLQHIYDQTHPIVENSTNTDPSVSKRYKFSSEHINTPTTSKTRINEYEELQINTEMNINEEIDVNKEVNIDEEINVNKEINIHKELNVNKEFYDIYMVTRECPDLKEVQCDPEDWIFQKKEKSKVHSCRIPLHIVFHNYVSSRRRLREAILCYQPINIEVIHKQLVGYGYKFDAKDLLKFLDKKCITVKTADSNDRNLKKSPRKTKKNDKLKRTASD